MEQNKKPNRERDERIALCFTPEEKGIVKDFAKMERLPASTLIRKIILDKAEEYKNKQKEKY